MRYLRHKKGGEKEMPIPEGYEAITVGMNLTGRTIRFLKTVEWQGYDPSDNGFLEYDGINGYFLKTNAGDIALLSNGADVNVQYYSTLPGVEFGENKINYSGFGFATTMPYSPININTDYIITGENAVVTYIHEVNEALDWDINDYIVVKSVVQKYITLDNLQEFLAKCDERYQLRTPQSGYNVHIRSTLNSLSMNITSGKAQYSTDNGGTWNTLTFQNIEGGDKPRAYLPVDLTGVTQIKFRSYKYSGYIYDVWQSDTLSLSFKNTGTKDTYAESDNFILTKEVSDIIVYIYS